MAERLIDVNTEHYVHKRDIEDWTAYKEKSQEMGVLIREGFEELSVQEQLNVLVTATTFAARETNGGSWVPDVVKKKPLKPLRQKATIPVNRLRKERNRARVTAKLCTGRRSSPRIAELTQTIKKIERTERDIKLNKFAKRTMGSGQDQRKEMFKWVEEMNGEGQITNTMKDEAGNIIHDPEVLKKEAVKLVESVFEAREFPNKELVVDEDDPKVLPHTEIAGGPKRREIKKLLKGLKVNKKSAGTTNIPPGLLKNMGEEMVGRTLQWCNKMYETETTPEEIGQSIITLLHKKGDKSNFKNYRTLAVGCNFSFIYRFFSKLSAADLLYVGKG